MLNENSLLKYFFADVVNIACYEFFQGRKPILSHLKVFGCKCFILNNGKKSLGKFDA